MGALCLHQSRCHGGGLVDLAPQTETWNTINRESFVNFWNVKPPVQT